MNNDQITAKSNELNLRNTQSNQGCDMPIEIDEKNFDADYVDFIDPKEIEKFKFSEETKNSLALLIKQEEKDKKTMSLLSKKQQQEKNDQSIILNFFRNNCPSSNTCTIDCFNSECLMPYYNYLYNSVMKIDDNYYQIVYSKLFTEQYQPFIINILPLSDNFIKQFPLPISCNHNINNETNVAIFHQFIRMNKLQVQNNKIYYGRQIDAIHSKISAFISDKKISYILAQNSKIFSDSSTAYAEYYHRHANTYYSLLPAACDLALNHYNNMANLAKRDMQKGPEEKRYSRLIPFLKLITNANISNLDKLAVMFAKIFLGRKQLEYLKNNKNATFIITNQSRLISDFLNDVFSRRISGSYDATLILPSFIPGNYATTDTFYHVTNYSPNYLSNPKNIEQLIHDRIIGNIVNIDTSSTSNNCDNLQLLLDGTAFTCSDELTGKLTYRSNAHYIFIRESIHDKLYENYHNKADTIDLSNSSDTPCIYQPLYLYEIFFLISGFVYYGIDLILNGNTADSNSSENDFFDIFIKKYCSITNNEEDYTYIKFLYEDYSQLALSNKSLKLSNNDFKGNLKRLFNDLEIKKLNKTINGQRIDANAYIGLKFNKAAYDNDLQASSKNTTSINSNNEFYRYLENILNCYS